MSLFAGTIAAFAVAGGVTIRRGSAGSDTKGRYTPGSTSDITGVEASVQPITGNELQRLPEGLRTQRPVKLYTTTEIRASSVATGVPSDLIVWDGETWEVQFVEKHIWGGYYKAVIIRKGQG